MKKLFTLAAAVLASFSLMAEDVTLVDINFKDASWTGKTFAQGNTSTPDVINGIYFYSKNTDKQFSLSDNETKGLKFPANNMKSNNYFFAIPLTDVHENIEVTLTHDYNEAKASYNYAFEDGREEFSATVSAAVTAVKDEKSESTSITFKVNATKENGFLYIGQAGSNFSQITGVKVVSQKGTAEPTLDVDVAKVELNAVMANPTPKAEVTFSGRNLAAGKYALTVPNLADLSVAPVEVEVGEDGKLNVKVTITYAPKEDVAAGETKLGLTIGELTKEVAIAYSASFVKDYEYGSSVNIEQWILDNGKNNADENHIGDAFKAVLETANIEFENVNALDSLNDEKDKRNEPFLGLKLKAQGAFVALWLKQGSTVRVKFGKVSDNVIGSVNGQEETFTPEFLANPLEFTAPVDCYMKLITTAKNTVVIKQVMVDESIAEVTLPDSPTAVDNIEAGAKVTKIVENGQLVIIKNGVKYNAQGTIVK